MSESLPPPMQPPEPVGPVQPGAVPTRDNAQVFGWIGIITAIFCCPLLGILFGYLSMQESRKFGKDETLGKVALWLGIGILALSVVSGIIFACLGGTGAWLNR
ncbi:hypothetical protein Rhe02_24790 [Rhizocola hellebori]|uniref:DUF4190 domain-containing protein n=1 Tax=Rhizocola hellebori TaxID=1392758 RepID=A0A8J3Q6R4_9ACTN|nr:hypothetical protein [Rhizocola hellebori]GIH04412.1 hypothetical protein Rhe02_24790 [Rhizocola hellebori]